MIFILKNSALLTASAIFLGLAVSNLAQPASVPAAFSPLKVVEGRIDARERGAIADGKTLNTAVINGLIADLSRAGGGVLVFAPGTYLTGTVVLLSNVTLQLDPGATILGSTEIADYPENPPPHPTSRLEYGRYALISVIGQHDVAIKGQGRIVGQGNHPSFTKKDSIARGMSANDAYLKRPFGLSFIGCSRVQVEGIKLENIAFWCEGYLDCDDVTVRGVTVDSKKHDYNNDGIDLDGCRNVRVSDCYFFVGDDAICLKASYRDCENITVTNCTASSLANGVKFGTASNFGFKNITVANIVLDGINAAGIALEIVDGGTMDGVSLSNFSMRDVGAAIFIRLGNVARLWTTDQPKPGIGSLRNVSISHVVAELGSGEARPLCSSITGLPGHAVENISLSDVQITSHRKHSRENGPIDFRSIPDVANSYPEYSMFGPLPAYGLYVRHVRGLTLRDVRFLFIEEDYRSAVMCDDVERVAISGLQARSLSSSSPVLFFNDVQGAFISGTALWDDVPVFLQLAGKSGGVRLAGNALSPARQTVVVEAPAEAAIINP